MIARIAKHLTALLVILAGTAGGVALADVVIGGTPSEELTAPDPTPVAGSESVEAHAPDARGGAPWAVRVYRIANGQLCSDFGREVEGQLGQLDADGAFHARRPEDAGGSCGDPDSALGALLSLTYYPDDPTTPGYEAPRTIVSGIAGRHVTGIHVAWPDQPVDVALSRRHAFISVYDGGPASLAVTVTYDDGSQATRDFTVPVSK